MENIKLEVQKHINRMRRSNGYMIGVSEKNGEREQSEVMTAPFRVRKHNESQAR